MLKQNKTKEQYLRERRLRSSKEHRIHLNFSAKWNYYCDKPIEDYQKATTAFIDDEKITQRLAKVRKVISENFDPTLGEDGMDDIERHMEGVEFWKP